MAEKEHLKEILREQMELLAEVSKNCNAEELSILTNAMSNLYLAYLQSSMYPEHANS